MLENMQLMDKELEETEKYNKSQMLKNARSSHISILKQNSTSGMAEQRDLERNIDRSVKLRNGAEVIGFGSEARFSKAYLKNLAVPYHFQQMNLTMQPGKPSNLESGTPPKMNKTKMYINSKSNSLRSTPAAPTPSSGLTTWHDEAPPVFLRHRLSTLIDTSRKLQKIKHSIHS